MNMESVKRIAVGVIAAVVLGIGAITVTQSTTYAAPANSGATIGYVDMQQIIKNSPDYKSAQTTLATEADTMQKEFDQKSVGLNDAEKKQLFGQYKQRFDLKQQEVMNQVKAKIDTTIKDVATAQGLSVVLDKNSVFYGGKDLTQDVIQKISK
jgi:outer membrane protein